MYQIVAASDQEVGGLIAILPPLYEILQSALVLLVALLPVGRYALPHIYKMMNERAAKIEEGLGTAEQAKAGQAAVILRREKIIREAHAEARTIRERANGEAKTIVAAARHEVTSKANRILEAFERQILAEKQAAQIPLRSEVGLFASELVEKIIGEHLTDTALTFCAVDCLLDELEVDSARIEGKR